jgi:DtxR family Mn-dependent transcriptional regulator
MTKAVQLTAALEDYLEAIFNLCRCDAAARSRDIAESLNVHKSTVTAALKTLGQMSLINYAPYEAVTLTDEGRRRAEDVVRRHAALKDFFINVLKVDAEVAENAACGMEHAVPREIVTKLASFAVQMRGCPRLDDDAGAAGGNVDGCGCNAGTERVETAMEDIALPEQARLDRVKAGDTVRITLVRGGGQGKKRLTETGLVRGAVLKAEKMAGKSGMTEVIVRGQRLSLKKEDAARVLVEEIAAESN